MAKEKEEKPKQPKKWAEKYDNNLFIKGTFEDVIQAAFVKDKKPKSDS